MAKSQPLTISEQKFETKSKLKEFIKAILHKYSVNVPLNTEDFQFMFELLKRHPECNTKIGCGINQIVIRPDGKWGKTMCFNIIRNDGTETDFSYITCIDNDMSREPIKMFKQSARSAISDQIVDFLTKYLNSNTNTKNMVTCQKTGEKIRREDATVDHIPPDTFDKLVKDFIEIYKLNPFVIEYVGFDDNQYNKDFKDNNIKSLFYDYHKKNAKLRVISDQENLRQKKFY